MATKLQKKAKRFNDKMQEASQGCLRASCGLMGCGLFLLLFGFIIMLVLAGVAGQ